MPDSSLSLGVLVFISSFAVVFFSNGVDPLAVAAMIPLFWGALHFNVLRFFAKARNRKRTVYAVTNERVVEKIGNRVRYVSMAHLPTLEVDSGRHRGRIAFGSLETLDGLWVTRVWAGRAHNRLLMAFFDIREADDVARIIEDAARSA